jgi:hypothetical protein
LHRFDAVWTPTVLLLDNEGKERVRLEGYLPNEDFLAALESGLGRISFVRKNYPDAMRWYNDVVARFGDSHWAAEVMYWRAVARYKATNDHTVLRVEETREAVGFLWLCPPFPASCPCKSTMACRGSPPSRTPPCRFPAAGSSDVTPRPRPGVGDPRSQQRELA